MILGICSNPDVLKVMRIIKIIINLIKIIVPIILIVSLMIDYTRAVSDGKLENAMKTLINKAITAIVIFLIPTFVTIIFKAADVNRDYYDCLGNATSAGIQNAYKEQVETLIDSAKENLSTSDYDLALITINKIKDEEMQKELKSELSELKTYITINEEIDSYITKSDSTLLAKIQEEIDDLAEGEYKEKLSQKLKDNIKTSGLSFNIDPGASKYDDDQLLSGKSLRDALSEKGYSLEKLNEKIKSNVESQGVGTRGAVVTSAITLIDTLSDYNLRINYFWGGKYKYLGANGDWGKITSCSACSSYPAGEAACKSKMIYSGLDCSGFVGWTLRNGFQDTSMSQINTEVHSGDISLSGQSKAVCQAGDVLLNEGHIVLVIGTDDTKNSYKIAESTGSYGTHFTYYSYNDGNYWCRKLDSMYK